MCYFRLYIREAQLQHGFSVVSPGPRQMRYSVANCVKSAAAAMELQVNILKCGQRGIDGQEKAM